MVDLAVLTHPDGDHFGGMGEVVRNLDVKRLWLRNIGARGGSALPAAAAVDELIALAQEHGAAVQEAWAGARAFGGAFTVVGPDVGYYQHLIEEQLAHAGVFVGGSRGAILEAAGGLWDRISWRIPLEVPLLEQDVTPRNNSSMITMLSVDGRRCLFTADAGVLALERAWDLAELMGLGGPPEFVQSSPRQSTQRVLRVARPAARKPGAPECRSAFVSVVADSDKHPSGRVVNAHIRRGCRVIATAGSKRYQYHGSVGRPGWSAANPLPPMDESDED